jgi:hypothetical protein
MVSGFWLLLDDYIRGSFLFVYGMGWSICCGGRWGCGMALSVIWYCSCMVLALLS